MTDITELAQSLKAAAIDAKELAIIARYSKGRAAAEKFYALANPNNVIALVEALEKVQSRDVTQAAKDYHFDQQADRIAELDTELEREREKTRRVMSRIAGLESRTVTAAAADVLAERQRQVTAEGWTAERDDGYQNSELADAAACYAIHAHNQGFSTPAHWPWSQDWWKQTSPRRDLVKAGALILAEIERLDRAAGIKVEAE
ncbi:TPA: ead/Ea22-like family protein [Klebsiella pneumoniae]|uniref:hypothetical protein n=1 Tax=Klebsiella TaxID=570 RepID=UPI000A363893|nr:MULTISPECIES: hypothetical protein [Klebsiella]AUB46688.1 Phage protein [Klebsiella pneumoniae]MCD9754027.1 ead/Ea22-like family protein [Klebsiella pneumoniae]MCD9864279.1 ead/Ea22-like family protein [Klebsiella pneumoniae]MCM6663751.1 ead/Ea22-like family protein [Klebsiella pneumoniae]MDF0743850.1 ead/Ea22-like family protein [Klebsiella pneumoniae]